MQKQKYLKNKLSIMDYISNALFGNVNDFSLDNKVFITSSLLAIFMACISLVANLYLGLPVILNVIIGLSIVVFSLLFYYARFKNRFSLFLFVSFSLSFLSLFYILNNGVNGPIPPVYILFVAVSISISNSKYHVIVLIVTIFNLLMLIVAENYFLEELITKYSNSKAREMDLSFGHIANLIVCYLLASFYKKTLTSRNAELHEINANKDLLLNIIAHDLRSPLNNISGFTSIMADKSVNMSLINFQEYSEIVNIEAIKVNDLLVSLLDWGKIQRNMVQTNFKTLNLYQTTSEIIDQFKSKREEKEIEIEMKILEDTFVFTDLDILKTIMRNLISNALKFTPHGRSIVISAEDFNHDYVEIIVKDNGIGMDKELIDNLFQLQTNTNRKGTDGEACNGLGLIITKELVEKQGGELRIESENNQGSTLKFTVLKSNKNFN